LRPFSERCHMTHLREFHRFDFLLGIGIGSERHTNIEEAHQITTTSSSAPSCASVRASRIPSKRIVRIRLGRIAIISYRRQPPSCPRYVYRLAAIREERDLRTGHTSKERTHKQRIFEQPFGMAVLSKVSCPWPHQCVNWTMERRIIVCSVRYFSLYFAIEACRRRLC
jgi:hypothetical protein